MRSPPASPSRSTSQPPSAGANRIGTRRSTLWIMKPRARRPAGRLSAMIANIAGEARLPHAEASTSARKNHGHEGAIA